MLCTLQGGDQDQAPGGPEVAPSTHPKVPDTQYMSRGRRLGIRQSMGWEKVCGSARSGIWVLHGDLKSRMLPTNLHHQSVRWDGEHTHDTALVHTRVVKEQQSNHKLFHSVEFQVRRRAQGAAPSSIRLDHGDFLVTDGLAQPEHVHPTVSGPTGSSGCLTFRW